ncbi:zinc-ribbon domain containing protein [Clostridium paraputrificum]|nr:zinc-ribbon domain containing protein [Clostridium paraputrificum]
MQDKVITCKDCGQEFTFTVGEQEFYKETRLMFGFFLCKYLVIIK